MSARRPAADERLFLGESEMARRMRAFDWSRTPLGPVESWSPALRMMVRILLANRFPMLLWWGPRYIQLYNDAYLPIPGAKHPSSMGQPGSECWPEIWHVIGPLVDTPFHGGPSTWMEDIFLEIRRHGFMEETHFTIAYSPVPDESFESGIGGVLATVHEITDKVVCERRVLALRDLGARAGEAKSAEEACVIAANTLGAHDRDVPFALLYLFAPDGKSAHLAAATGVGPLPTFEAISPEVVDLVEANADGWPFVEAKGSQAWRVVDRLDERFGAVPPGPWSDPPDVAVVLPIPSNTPHQPVGLLVAGVSARLKLDKFYRGFLELVTTQIATAIANARAYDEERRRAEALAELDRAKTDFFSNVSHEFRTPLTLLLGPTEDLLASEGVLAPEAQGQLVLVHRNALRLQKLVNTLLDFSRIEAGRIQACYQPTDLAEATRDLASVFRSAIERAGLTLIVECPPLPHFIYVDGEMWEKIVLNLMSNAFKFTFEGEIEVGLRPAGDAVLLSIRDTGVGIPERELPHIFERFHRVQETRGRSHEGSGIGLALVQELVRLHGGSVEVESVEGRGTTFSVSIPMGKAHLPEERIGKERTLDSTTLKAPVFVEEALRWLPDGGELEPDGILLGGEPPSGRSAEKKARILLTDDNADMREYLRRLLHERYHVEVVADGDAALESAVIRPPDLVISDVMMPRLDGLSLLHALRNDDRTRTVPVILLSARAGEESRVEGMSQGADDYLVKPFSGRELLARVGATLSLARVRHESFRREEELRAETVSILEGMTEGFMAFDSEWRIVYVNRAVEGTTGLARADLLGNDHWEAFPETLGTVVEREYRRAMAERVPVSFQNYYEPLKRWFEIDAYPVPEGGLVVYGRDVTERKRTEEALRESDAKLRLSHKAAGAGTWTWERSTGVITWSEETYELFGIDPAVPVSYDAWRQALHPDDAERADRAARQAMERLDDLDVEYRIHHRHRGERWLTSKGRIMDPVNRPGIMTGISLDITERKRAEEALREADRRKDEFLAILAHELRNPLAPIRTGLELIRLQGNDPRSVERTRAMIERQVAHMVRLIDDLLDVSRISSGKIQLHRETVELARIVNGAVEANRSFIDASGLELGVALPAAPVYLDADETRLTQVLSNLLHNACKFTEPGGSISLTADLTTPRSDGRAELRLSVKDTGVGIPPGMLSRVFDLFEQVESELPPSKSGLGIGLTLARRLVEMHDGRIEAGSGGVGSGSEFVLHLPVVAGDAVRHPNAPSDPLQQPGSVKRRVLIVDDNRDAADSLAAMVALLGGEVRTAHDGPSGVEAAASFRPDVILLDIGLPGLDGYEACRRIRALPWGKEICLVALTGWGNDRDKQRAADAGFNLHLRKPADPTVLKRFLASQE